MCVGKFVVFVGNFVLLSVNSYISSENLYISSAILYIPSANFTLSPLLENALGTSLGLLVMLLEVIGRLVILYSPQIWPLNWNKSQSLGYELSVSKQIYYTMQFKPFQLEFHESSSKQLFRSSLQ